MKKTLILLAVIAMGVFALALIKPDAPPPAPVEPYLNGVFPATAPGGTWGLEPLWDDLSIPSPVKIVAFPGTDDLLVLSKTGQLWRISLENKTQEQVLDLSDQTFWLGECGAVGLALHPNFGEEHAPDQQLAFIFYRSQPNPAQWSDSGYNRLSKFRWDAQKGKFDKSSEEILIQQFDRYTWHNGGGMFFGKDGFLYLGLGDEGHPDFIPQSTQRLNGGFFSGVLRIDVDNDPDRSHPIRRQPKPNGAVPTGWWNTFSQGYSIPNDNPWQSPDSSTLEEFYAIGVRSPFSMTYDQEANQIWLADVGSDKREEINLVKKGTNLQWPYMEGTFSLEKNNPRPAVIQGIEAPPLIEYDRSIGSCAVGGGVYRGTQFPSLNGKFVFGDFVNHRLLALSHSASSPDLEIEVLIWDTFGQPVDMPERGGTATVVPLDNGEILIGILDLNFDKPGRIFRLVQYQEVPEPPGRLSELEAFTDLKSLTPAPGLIPYRVNAPLWSDRAVKKRWVALPNDGQFNRPEEQVQFDRLDNWKFPEGTVFVKHFELPRETDTVRLETRFFIVGKDRAGYGLTYKWNEEGTEAYLQGGGSSRDIVVGERFVDGGVQTWDYPSRQQCLSCHTANAGYVLGVKTTQLNGTLFYPSLGRTANQLDYWNELNIFSKTIQPAGNYNKTYHLEDKSAPLEHRIRSYFDANCSPCHRPGGVPTVYMDMRYDTPLSLQGLVNASTQSLSSDPDRLIVQPGSHADSELWVRDASWNDNRMPPLASHLVDETYVHLLAEWIDGLPEDAGKVTALKLYPNPGSGWFNIRLNDDWELPAIVRVFDMAGRLVLEQSFEVNFFQVDLSEQAPGSYLLQVQTDSEEDTQVLVLQ